jgi:FAD/FMN-containing dehydrogenase
MMADLSQLATRFAGRLLTDPVDTAPFLTDWRGLWHGRALAVAQPDTPQGVAAIVRWCSEHGVPLVPQGGNTGMSGGATPDESGAALVLSLTRLNRIRSIDAANDTISVDAGCVLATVQEAAREVGRFFPLSLGAEGSCTIGGNLATNAGGTAVLRYGNARDLCLGIEVVTAQGELWDGMKGLRKDNSGYDLRDLIIGSEGTLGVITGAVLKLFPAPSGHLTAFVALPDPAAALRLLQEMTDRLGQLLTAFELVSAACLDLVESHVPGARSPLEGRAAWYALVELSLATDDEAERAGFEAVLADAFERGVVSDAAIAASEAQRQAFWRLRESISEAQNAIGKTIKHDIALPRSAIPAFLDEAEAALRGLTGEMIAVTFGHLGDGNLHYNFSPRVGADQQSFIAAQDEINHLVHNIVASRGGSFSAEHGLGMLRRDEAKRLKSPVEMAMMAAVKRALDPQAILNPGKVLA